MMSQGKIRTLMALFLIDLVILVIYHIPLFNMGKHLLSSPISWGLFLSQVVAGVLLVALTYVWVIKEAQYFTATSEMAEHFFPMPFLIAALIGAIVLLIVAEPPTVAHAIAGAFIGVMLYFPGLMYIFSFRIQLEL